MYKTDSDLDLKQNIEGKIVDKSNKNNCLIFLLSPVTVSQNIGSQQLSGLSVPRYARGHVFEPPFLCVMLIFFLDPR